MIRSKISNFAQTLINFLNNVELPFMAVINRRKAISSADMAHFYLFHKLRANNAIASYHLASAFTDRALLQFCNLQVNDTAGYGCKR